MNEKVIEEIANQLGLAVDQASQLVAQVIPQYAAMKVMERSIEAAGFVLLVIVSAVVAIIAIRNYKRAPEMVSVFDRDEKEKWFYIALTSLLVGAFATAITLFLVQQAAGWAMFPDAKVAEMVLDAIKGGR